MNPLGRVVTIVNVLSHSPVASSFRPVQRPASASGRPSGSWIRIGWRRDPSRSHS
jgi:hypothetical protein